MLLGSILHLVSVTMAQDNHSQVHFLNIIGRFSVQESGEGADQDLPAWLTAAPSSTVKSYTNSKDLDMNERSYELEGMY